MYEMFGVVHMNVFDLLISPRKTKSQFSKN